MDPKVNGQLQHEWGWLIAVYLFLGGVGGGAYTIAAINSFLGDGLGLSTTVGLWIGFPALLVGSIFLIADLGSPVRALLAGMKPGTSWIAMATRGTVFGPRPPNTRYWFRSVAKPSPGRGLRAG